MLLPAPARTVELLAAAVPLLAAAELELVPVELFATAVPLLAAAELELEPVAPLPVLPPLPPLPPLLPAAAPRASPVNKGTRRTKVVNTAENFIAIVWCVERKKNVKERNERLHRSHEWASRRRTLDLQGPDQ